MTITIHKGDPLPVGGLSYRAVTHDRGGQQVAGEGESIPAALRELAAFIEATSFEVEDG